MNTKRYIAALALALGAAIAAPAAKPDAVHGATLYKEQCATCHGADGKGQTVVGKNFKLRDLSSAAVQALSDSQLEEIIAKGKGRMPASSAHLGQDGVRDVVAYVRQLAKK
jgi:mono/diheme cytochrome c family protein